MTAFQARKHENFLLTIHTKTMKLKLKQKVSIYDRQKGTRNFTPANEISSH